MKSHSLTLICVALGTLLIAGSRTALTAAEEEATYLGQPVAYWTAALKADDSWLRWQAVRALRHLQPSDEASIKSFAAALLDKRVKVRMAAAEALVALGENARPAVA